MLHLFGAVKVGTFLGGALVGAVGVSALKTETARKVAVSGIATGMKVKNSVAEQLCNLKEEAQDLCAEAAKKAQKDAEVVDFDSFDQDVEL